MANRVTPTPPDADNPSGSFMLAACSDWRSGARRFHVGTGHVEPTHDAGYTTAGLLARPELSISSLLFGGVHIRAVRTHSQRSSLRKSGPKCWRKGLRSRIPSTD